MTFVTRALNRRYAWTRDESCRHRFGAPSKEQQHFRLTFSPNEVPGFPGVTPVIARTLSGTSSGNPNDPCNTFQFIALDTSMLFQLTLNPSGGGPAIVRNFSDLTPAAVPEPTTLGLMGLGLAGLAFVRRRRAQVAA